MPSNRVRNLQRRILRTFSRAWLICGIGALITGCGFGVYRSLWLSRSFSAIGTIDSVSEVVDQQNSGIDYAPKFTFSATDGKVYTVTSGVASNPPDFEVGEHVRVRY